MTKKELLEVAIDLTYLAMNDPCEEDHQYLIETRHELMTQHYALLKALEELDGIHASRQN
jgi:hypothetical protein